MATVSGTTGSTTSTTPASTTTGTTGTGTGAASTTTSSPSTVTNVSTGSGPFSNINWTALVNAAVAARSAPAAVLDTKVSTNQIKVSAYTDMQTLLSNLSRKAFALSGPSGISTAATDVFRQRSATATSSGSTPAASIVSVTADPGTDAGSFSLRISQLATAQKVASDTQTSQSTALGYTGTFSLKLGNGSPANISVNANMTLGDVAQAINAQSAATNVKASVVQVATGSFKLVLFGTDTGADMSTSVVSGDDVLNKLGVTSLTGSFNNELQKSQGAVFTYEGVSVTRSSNTVTDLVKGITLNLLGTTSNNDSVTVSVKNNATAVKTAISDLVDAYNSYRAWAMSQQSFSSSGEASADAVLFGDSNVRSANSQIYNALARAISGTNINLIGLSYDTNNNLQIDDTKLTNALATNFSAVQTLFSFGQTSSSSDLKLLAHYNNDVGNFNINVEVDGSGNLTGASVNGDSSLFTVSGARIIGARGTKYDGMVFVYTGNSSQTISVSTTNGIAEGIYATTRAMSDSQTGTLQTVIDSLTAQNKDMQKRAADIRAQANAYSEVLTQQYSRYQTSVQSASSTLNYLTTLINANNKSG